MVKAAKWIRRILSGSKKDKVKAQKDNPITPIVITTPIPKEKKRWSFRRSSAAPSKGSNGNISTPSKQQEVEKVVKAKLDVIEVVEKEETTKEKEGVIREAAATKIQSVFRSYLARKALRALRGLVKLQALVRGRLVRNRATATLKCMEALITAQARARAQRIHSAYRTRNSYHEVEKGMMEDNIKIVEMDIGQSRTKPKPKTINNNERRDDRFTTYYASDSEYTKQDYHYYYNNNNNKNNNKISPSPSQITDISPRTCSGHFEDYYYYSSNPNPNPNPNPNSESFSYDYPSYMANTQSSRAKARSQSAPKQRPDSFERQLSRRRPSVEGRNIPRAVRMQRSSSNVGPTSQNYNYPPWSIKLDKSSVSVIDSECGSNCSVLTTANYCRSVVGPYDDHGHRY